MEPTVMQSAEIGAGDQPVRVEPVPATLPPETAARVAERSRLATTSLGEIVSILMSSAAHRRLFLADLDWLVAPALATGQFATARARHKANGLTVPVAAILWASVSEEIDARLTAEVSHPIRLRPDEWRSGPIVWLVGGIGEPRAVKALIEQTLLGPLKGRTLKVATRDAEGNPVVERLAVSSASTSAAPSIS